MYDFAFNILDFCLSLLKITIVIQTHPKILLSKSWPIPRKWINLQQYLNQNHIFSIVIEIISNESCWVCMSETIWTIYDSQKTCRRKDPGTRSREVELGFIFSLGLETTLKDIKCAASENIIAIAAYFVTILTLSAYPLIELFSVIRIYFLFPISCVMLEFYFTSYYVFLSFKVSFNLLIFSLQNTLIRPVWMVPQINMLYIE